MTFTALLIDLSNTLEAETFMRGSHYALLPGGKNSPKMHHVKDAQYFVKYFSNAYKAKTDLRTVLLTT